MTHNGGVSNPKLGAVPPNLIDYEETRATFSWAAARDEFDGLPGGRGLNIAHECVDRLFASRTGFWHLSTGDLLQRLLAGRLTLAVQIVVPLRVLLRRLAARGRADDRPEVAVHRLATHCHTSEPLLGWLAARGNWTTSERNDDQRAR